MMLSLSFSPLLLLPCRDAAMSATPARHFAAAEERRLPALVMLRQPLLLLTLTMMMLLAIAG